jgi:hypothetical protein
MDIALLHGLDVGLPVTFAIFFLVLDLRSID